MNENSIVENSNKATDKKVKNNIIHTDNYPKVLKDFQNRLISLMNAPDSTCRTEQQLSKLLKLPVRNVKPWVAGTRLPRAEVFPLLASIYKRPIDWFFGGEHSKPLTYSGAFLSLEALEDIVEIQTITDPFLHFMMSESNRIKYNNFLPESEKTSWRLRFLNDFEEPLLPEDLLDRIDAGLKIYSRVNQYDTYVACLKKMTQYHQSVGVGTEPFEIWAIHESNRLDLLNSVGEPKETSLYPMEWMEHYTEDIPEFIPECYHESEGRRRKNDYHRQFGRRTCKSR